MPGRKSAGIGVAVGNCIPGLGSKITWPGKTFWVLGSMPIGSKVSGDIPPYGLSNRISAIPSSPRLNFSTINARYSPSCTVYVNGDENVAVVVIVGVDVGGGVSVGGDVFVGVKVRVGVGVSVANSALSG